MIIALIHVCFQGEFLNLKHPKIPPYTVEELTPITDEQSKMMYMWITAYTVNTFLFALNQTKSKQYMFDSNNVSTTGCRNVASFSVNYRLLYSFIILLTCI